jgi:hypothetical protein
MVSEFFRVVGKIKFMARILFTPYIRCIIYSAQHIPCLALIIVMAGTPAAPPAATACRVRMNHSTRVLEHPGCITALRAILQELFVNGLDSIGLWQLCRGIVAICMIGVI